MRFIKEGALPTGALSRFSPSREPGTPIGGSGDSRRADLATWLPGTREAPPAPGRAPRVRRSVHVRGPIPAPGSSPFPKAEPVTSSGVARTDQAGRQPVPAPLRADAGKDPGDQPGKQDRPAERPAGEEVYHRDVVDAPGRAGTDRPATPAAGGAGRGTPLPPEHLPAAGDEGNGRINVAQRIQEVLADTSLNRAENAPPLVDQITSILQRIITDAPATVIRGSVLPDNLDELFGIDPHDDPDATRSAVANLHASNLIFTLNLPDAETASTYVVRNEPNREISLTVQAETAIRVAIDAGILRPGDRLPTVRRWVEDYNLNQGEVQKIFRNLTEAGLILGRTKRGTIVTENRPSPEQLVPARTRIIQHIISLIAIGAIKPGDRVPGNSVLASQFDTSSSSVYMALRGSELQSLLVEGTTVAEISPISQVALFLRNYRQQEEKSAEAVRSAQEIALFLREYILTRNGGEQLPTINQLVQLFHSTYSSVRTAYDQLRKDQLIVMEHGGRLGTHIAGERVTDRPQIESFVRERLASQPAGEPLPSVRTLVYDLAVTDAMRPIIIQSPEQIAALMREYIRYQQAGDSLPSQEEFAAILGTSTRPIRDAYQTLQEEGLVSSTNAGTRVGTENIPMVKQVEIRMRELLSHLPPDARLPGAIRLATQYGTSPRTVQYIFAKFIEEGLTYSDGKRTYATGEAYVPENENAESDN
ncbi:MAG TPA: GntR family transcriptional regulator [Candidatus Acidoferrales bacterium]|nr:GntR family transcriptional regulator [Candidatus Acidoferrales bacterium]